MESIGSHKNHNSPVYTITTPSLSLILGAGFSVPMGYPTGDKVNKSLMEFEYEQYDISPTGILFENERPNTTLSSQYQRNLEFCKRVIEKYVSVNNGIFDYEVFFDFIHSNKIFEQQYECCADGLVLEFEEYKDFVDGLDNIFTQMVSIVIKDKNGEKWYDNKPNQIGYVEGYDTFLKTLSKWSSDYIVNVHTLNHDMLFESFNKTEYLAGKISDGFDEYGSIYYGEITTSKNRRYNVRLERYSARYENPIRLYKLHGSLDYIIYFKSDGLCLSPDRCIKTRYGVDMLSLKREIVGKMRYERFPFAYHADFLSGVNTKIKKYSHNIYNELHKRFHYNLKSAKKLIIVGYGGKDKAINDAVLQNYEYKRKTTIIIDPFPSDILIQFADKLGATIIQKSVSDVTEDELMQ